MLVDRRTLLTRGPSVPRTMVRRQRTCGCASIASAMACRFEVLLSGEDQRHTAAAHDALREADRLDAAWSIYRDDSELSAPQSRRRRRPGRASTPSCSRCSRTPHELWRRTGGAFDITTTPLSRCWGFVAREGRVPTPRPRSTRRAPLVGMDRADARRRRTHRAFRAPGVEINLGAIGKGAAVDAIADASRAPTASATRWSPPPAAASAPSADATAASASTCTSPLVDRPRSPACACAAARSAPAASACSPSCRTGGATAT